MKKGRIVYILVILSILAVIAIPVMAANETQRDNATDYYNLGVLSLSSNDSTNAITYFDEALASNTTMIKESDALLYTYQGKSFAQIQLGLYSAAIETTNQGLAIYPDDVNLLNNKGYAFYKVGDYQDAVTAYDQALAIDSTQNRTWVNKGDALYQMGDYQGAVAAYTTALGNTSSNQVESTDATIKLAKAQKAAATAGSALMIFGVIVVIIVAGCAIVYYIKRTPVSQETTEKPVKEVNKKKK
jgi:tetratricopeptide (TPR) repeat protein